MAEEHVHSVSYYTNEAKCVGSNSEGNLWEQWTWGVCLCGHEFGKTKSDSWVDYANK